MCQTGEYRERGIRGRDGYQTEFVVDTERYVVRIPRDLEASGVLTVPLSIVEKAIDEALRIQFSRLPAALSTPDWIRGRRCLIAGIGPVGLLAALALRVRGATVCALDIVPEDSPRPQWLKKIGGRYLNGKEIEPAQIRKSQGPFELLFEATGVPTLAFDLLETLDYNGIYIMTGIDRKSTRLNSSHMSISYDVLYLIKKII